MLFSLSCIECQVRTEFVAGKSSRLLEKLLLTCFVKKLKFGEEIK